MGDVGDLGARDTGRVLRGMAVLPLRVASRPPRDHHDGHAGRARRRGRVRLQRVRDGHRCGRTLLRHRRGDRDVDPGGQDARGTCAGVGRRRRPHAARTRGHGGDDPGRRRRTACADRRAAPGEHRRGPSRREDPRGRGRQGRHVLGGPLDAHRRVGARRRGPRERGRRGLDQRSRPAGGLRHEGRGEHEAVRDRAAPGDRRRGRRHPSRGSPTASRRSSCRS